MQEVTLAAELEDDRTAAMQIRRRGGALESAGSLRYATARLHGSFNPAQHRLFETDNRRDRLIQAHGSSRSYRTW